MFKTDSENPDFPTEIIRKTKLKSTDYEAKPPVIFKFLNLRPLHYFCIENNHS